MDTAPAGIPGNRYHRSEPLGQPGQGGYRHPAGGTPVILSELKTYLQQRGQATLADVVNHFDVDANVARDMLQVWIRKGKVHKLQAAASCGS
ncbi:FeoC-like transcriptional regulator, partial [Thiolapillus sp.]|uniref:FeoC-like transcriptional regulator n=1 Tax=Thiolapillus sp. TaxID=2017437 RepID=UPI003AF6CFF2